MGFLPFDGPSISWPLVRRRAAEDLLYWFDCYVTLLRTNGKRISPGACYEDKKSYYAAVYRLRKAGLLTPTTPGRGGSILLTETGLNALAPYARPKRYWKRRWNGRWFLLVYDVPEEERQYRDVLRRFLREHRMGELQRSVYVTPHDIRPLYEDLAKATGIRGYAMLFETHSVLAMHDEQVVTSAWDFDLLDSRQAYYCRTAAANLDQLISGPYTRTELESLARDELQGYRLAMVDDPLLPEKLLPRTYLGKKVFRLHTKMVKAIAERL
jgi:phenylacetic acid degradation operon negative regulatory protein